MDLPFASEVVTRWISDDRYLDARGVPRVLPVCPRRHPRPTFDELVAGISTDVRPRVLLDELVRLGVAAKTKEGDVNLSSRHSCRRKTARSGSSGSAGNIHDHLAACVHNLVDRRPPMMEQSVFSFELSDASVGNTSRS